jgi:hypothetical protein
MENNIQTAEEFFNQFGGYTREEMLERAIEFAKAHTEAALKAASLTIRPEYLAQGTDIVVAKKKILSAYPLNNIK